MTWSGATAALAALLLSAPAMAQTTPPPANPPPATTDQPVLPPARTSAQPRIGWAGIGVYDVTVSTPFGSFSDSNFGINAGGAMNVGALSPDVPLALFGNIAMIFASGGQYFPIDVGAAARYDKIPVHLLGGLSFTLMPNSTGVDTGLGLGVFAMGMYPLQTVDPRLSLEAQIQYHFLNHSMSLLAFTIGAGYAL